MNKTLWLEVSNDKYQLPLCVAETALELAITRGTTTNSIYSNIYHYKIGKIPKPKYIRVEIEENDEDED